MQNFVPSITVFPTTAGNWDVVLRYLNDQNAETVARCKVPMATGRGELAGKAITLEPADDFASMAVTFKRKKRTLKQYEKDGRIRFWSALTPMQGADEIASLEQMRALYEREFKKRSA